MFLPRRDRTFNLEFSQGIEKLLFISNFAKTEICAEPTLIWKTQVCPEALYAPLFTRLYGSVWETQTTRGVYHCVQVFLKAASYVKKKHMTLLWKKVVDA